MNQLPDQYMSLGSRLQQQVTNPFYPTLYPGIASTPTAPQGQVLLPYPQYTSVSVIAAADLDSIYHSMQLKMEKRFRAGGTILAAYTVSKTISNTDTLTGWLDSTGTTQDNNNFRLERSLIGTDVPQRLVVSHVLDLPVGKGKTLFGGASGVAGKLISGWGINGVSTIQSACPLLLTTNTNLTNSFA